MIDRIAKRCLGVACLVFTAGMAPSEAGTVALNFNDFTAVPANRIVISSGGSMAVFSEDPVTSPIALEYLNFVVPANATTLSFAYELEIPANNEDYFDFYLGNLTTPIFSQGGFEPGVFTGSPAFNITPYAGGQASLVFDLIAGFGDAALTSQLTLLNPRLILADIDAPETLFLLTLGLAGVLAFGLRSPLPIGMPE
ncbi:MAG: hypothetical protein U1F76_21280 [Candidatus Competibacteraceae bacterium]